MNRDLLLHCIDHSVPAGLSFGGYMALRIGFDHADKVVSRLETLTEEELKKHETFYHSTVVREEPLMYKQIHFHANQAAYWLIISASLWTLAFRRLYNLGKTKTL